MHQDLDTHFGNQSKNPSYSPVSLLSTFVEIFSFEDSFVAHASDDTDLSYQIPDYLMFVLHINDINTFVSEFNYMINFMLIEHVVGSFVALYNEYKCNHQKICEQFRCYQQHDKIDTNKVKICFNDECDHNEDCQKNCTLNEFVDKRIEEWKKKNKE